MGGKSALDLAMEMMDSFKGLKGIDNASIKEFASLKGMGAAKVAQLRAAFELGRHTSSNQIPDSKKFGY